MSVNIDSMRAIIFHNACSPKDLKISTTSIPKMQNDEILIKVKAFGLNFADTLARKGTYNDAPNFPFIPGYEISGDIIDIGSDAINHVDLKKGDRVIAFTRFGGYAEYVSTKYYGVFKLPDHLSYVDGASIPVNFVTSYYCLFNTGILSKGDRVLIHSGAGGVGQIAIQMAKLHGCEIFTTSSSDDKLKMLKDQYNVDHTINYSKLNFVDEIKKLTNNEGVDVILDAIGGTQIKNQIPILRPGGRIISFGASSLTSTTGIINFLYKIKGVFSMVTINLIDLLLHSKSICCVNCLRLADTKPQIISNVLKTCIEWVNDGKIKTVVSRTYPWEETGKAHDDLESRRTTGKIVLTIDE